MSEAYTAAKPICRTKAINSFCGTRYFACIHLYARCLFFVSDWSEQTVHSTPLCMTVMTFATFWNVILGRFNQKIKETTGPLQIDTGQFISRRYCDSGSIVKHLLCITEEHRGHQFKLEISLRVMTENELDYVQIKELLLKSLNPLKADKARWPDSMNLYVLGVTSKEINKTVADFCFQICFRGLESRETSHYFICLKKKQNVIMRINLRVICFILGESWVLS